jgi:outer membrane murein-binding lipoprotein Lpp
VRDFKRNVKGLILESNSSIDLVQDIDNGAIFHYQNKINTFLNNTIKEVVSIVRDTNANLLTKISQGKIIDGDMVFNTTENTYQQVIAGQLVSFGSGGGVDPALEGRVDDLESAVSDLQSSVSDLESDVQAIVTNQEEMDDNLAIARAELYDLINLTGMPENSDNLGPFSGAYLTDGLTIKEALQQLETAVEAELATTALDLSSINNQILDLQDALDAESTNRINGDASTLAAANAYTDAEIAAIPGVDLSAIESDISTLQLADTGLQTQINTINNTTIPAAIDSANSYTDAQIAALPTGGSAFETLSHIFYLETFEGTIQGTISGGASIIDIATNPLQVLSESKSLYLPHSTAVEQFISSPIDIPNICKKYIWNGSSVQQLVEFYISLDVLTSVSFTNQVPETPSAVLRVYDITNGEYIVLDFSPVVTFPLNTYQPLRGPQNGLLLGVLGSATTEQVRIEITSNTTNSGDTVIDNIRLSVRTLQG